MNKVHSRLNSRLFLTLIFGLPVWLQAQSQTVLTLEESVSLAEKQSPAMQKALLQLRQSWFSYESARLQFWSTLDLKSTVPYISNDINRVSDPQTGKYTFVRQNYVTYSSELTLTQPIIWTDADVSLVGGLSQFRQTYNGTAQTNYLSDLRLRISQPLFTYNRRGFGLERAELTLEMAKKQYLTAQQDVLYRAKQAWFNWYRAEQTVLIAESELSQTQASWELAQKKYDAGIIAEVDKLKLEVDFASARNSVLQRKTEANQAENQVKLILGLPLDDKLTLPGGFETKTIDIPVDRILSTALKNRPEIENARRQVRLQEMAVEETDAQREFRADLNFEIGLKRQDPVLGEAFLDPDKTRQVSLNLTIPIFDWGQNRASTAGQAAGLEMEQIDQRETERSISTEIRLLTESYRQSADRLKILEKTVELAQKSYDISYQKFRSGSLSSEDLAQAQRRLTEAKTSVLSARMDYQLSIAALNKASLFDWEKGTGLENALPDLED